MADQVKLSDLLVQMRVTNRLLAAQIKTSFAGLAAMGDNPTLPLKVSKGRAMLGFIPLGNLPPL